MNNEYCIHWLVWHNNEWTANFRIVSELTKALELCKELRNYSDVRFVTMVAEHSDMVGKQGVDSVKAEDYTWTKRR